MLCDFFSRRYNKTCLGNRRAIKTLRMIKFRDAEGRLPADDPR